MNDTSTRNLLISARSFGRNDPRHLDRLKDDGFIIHEFREGENAERKEVLQYLPDMDAWVVSTFPIDEEALAQCTRMKVIIKHGVGVDNIDVPAATRRGIPVLNAPGSNHIPVADLAMTHLLSFTRRIIDAHQSVREGRWERFLGTGVYGKTLAIIGVGRIGRAIARRAAGFGINCIGYDPYQEDPFFHEAGIVRRATLEDALQHADFVSINIPLTEETRGLITHETIAVMKPHALIINTSRGSVVDEQAICRALDEKRIGGYATDVYESEPPQGSPLLGYSNVQCTPHIASYTEDSMRSLGDSVIEGIRAVFSGNYPEHILNDEVLAGTASPAPVNQ